MRNILFVAYDLMLRTTVRNEKEQRGLRHVSERYVEQRQVLQTYGKLIAERTSGVHRVVTPPEGIDRGDPEAGRRVGHDAEAERLLHGIIGKLPISDCVVLPADSGLDGPLKLIILTALAQGVPVLILKHEKPAIIVATSDDFRDCEGVTYIEYSELSHPRGMHDFRAKISRYMQSIPARVRAHIG